MDGVRSSFRGDCRAGTASRSGTGGAIWFSPGNVVDLDWRDAGRRRARHDHLVCVRPARRQDIRPDRERGNRAGRRRTRAHQRPRDHDYSFGRPRARGCPGAGQKSVGRVHDCDDNSNRTDHGGRPAQRKIQRRMDHRVRIVWADLGSLGRTISRSKFGFDTIKNGSPGRS